MPASASNQKSQQPSPSAMANKDFLRQMDTKPKTAHNSRNNSISFTNNQVMR